jgi:hypothetical protein
MRCEGEEAIDGVAIDLYWLYSIESLIPKEEVLQRREVEFEELKT